MEPNGNMKVSRMAIDSKRNITGDSGVNSGEEIRMHEYNTYIVWAEVFIVSLVGILLIGMHLTLDHFIDQLSSCCVIRKNYHLP